MTTLVQGLNIFGRWLFEHLWGMSIELAVMAAVVLAVIFILCVHSPRIKHLFWGLVLAKPVITFLIASPLSLYWFLQPPVEANAPLSSQPAIERPASAVMELPATGLAGEQQRGTPHLPASSPTPAWRTLDRYGAMALLWILVAAAFAARLIAGCAYVHSLRRHARLCAEGPLVDLLNEATAAFRMQRRVRVAVTATMHGPVLAGVFRPVILLPERVAQEMTPEQIRHILAHELAHVRRWDNLVLLIQRLAEMLLFFHPAVWLCGWAMRREAESACDDMVIAIYGRSAEYADSLTRVAEMREGLTRRLLVNTFAAAESNMAKRVHRILRSNPSKTAFSLTATSICALIVIGCLGLPTATERKTNEKKGDTLMSKTITNVPVITWKETGDCTFAAALQAALAVTKHPVSYTDIMAYSALAFRVRWRGPEAKGWCPSIPVGEFPEEVGEVARLSGWRFNNLPDFFANPEGINKYIPDVIDSLNHELPVVGYPTTNNLNCGVIYGYERKDGKQVFLWRDMFKGQEPLEVPEDKTGPWLLFLKEWSEPLPQKTRLLEVLKRAVAHWSRQPVAAGSKYSYSYGREALTLWISDLQTADKFSAAEQSGLFFENWWNFSTFCDARKHAAKYLAATAPTLDQNSRQLLEKAASIYQKEYELLSQAFSTKNAFLGPWSGKSQKEWTPEVRQREQQILKEALALETEAVGCLEKAIANLMPPIKSSI